MLRFKRFEPNKKETFVCSLCPHAFDRHITAGGLVGCMIRRCRCNASGTFTRPVPPVLEEYVSDLQTGARHRINQPAPPVIPGVV